MRIAGLATVELNHWLWQYDIKAFAVNLFGANHAVFEVFVYYVRNHTDTCNQQAIPIHECNNCCMWFLHAMHSLRECIYRFFMCSMGPMPYVLEFIDI